MKGNERQTGRVIVIILVIGAVVFHCTGRRSPLPQRACKGLSPVHEEGASSPTRRDVLSQHPLEMCTRSQWIRIAEY
jgi:hypothetical protein